MIRNEIRIFFTALMFYTRIPVPAFTGYSAANLNKATRYFPLVGCIVGGIGALVFTGAHYLFTTQVALLFSLGAMIMTTGAFHEDAVSDFCDGFGGGYTKAKILEIMKDSRIGTYGALALAMLMLSKFVLLSAIKVESIPIVILSAHAFSRVNPVLMIYFSKYVREDADSKSKPIGEKSSVSTLVIAIVTGIAPLMLIPGIIIPFVLITTLLVFAFLRHYVHKKIGGYTGDVLGALQQFSEIGFYMAYIGASKLL